MIKRMLGRSRSPEEASANKVARAAARRVDRGLAWAARFTREDFVYDAGMTLDAKRALFKKNISTVEFEPNSFCNRTCSFCPNVFIDRIKNKVAFDRRLYEKIVADLASIGYDQRVRFARYSEPTAYLEPLCEMISIARRSCPRADIDVVTNGDYLKPQSLAALAEAGLSILRISIYPDVRGEVWSVEKSIDTIHRLGKRIGIRPSKIRAGELSVRCNYRFRGMEIRAKSLDLTRVGNDRAASMKELVDDGYVRTSPCSLVYENFTIDYDGSVMPCCNLRSDSDEQVEHRIATLAADRDLSIFDVYANEGYARWRRSMAVVSKKDPPCRSCKQDTYGEGAALERLASEIERRLEQIDVPLNK